MPPARRTPEQAGRGLCSGSRRRRHLLLRLSYRPRCFSLSRPGPRPRYPCLPSRAVHRSTRGLCDSYYPAVSRPSSCHLVHPGRQTSPARGQVEQTVGSAVGAGRAEHDRQQNQTGHRGCPEGPEGNTPCSRGSTSGLPHVRGPRIRARGRVHRLERDQAQAGRGERGVLDCAAVAGVARRMDHDGSRRGLPPPHDREPRPHTKPLATASNNLSVNYGGLGRRNEGLTV